jgi:hypothetical protein
MLTDLLIFTIRCLHTTGLPPPDGERERVIVSRRQWHSNNLQALLFHLLAEVLGNSGGKASPDCLILTELRELRPSFWGRHCKENMWKTFFSLFCYFTIYYSG